MKKFCLAFSVAVVTIVFLSIFTHSGSPAATKSQPPAPVESCSCSAPDGSCSVNLECRGGCEKHCGPNDDCWAYCSGAFGVLGMETTLEIQNGTYAQLVSELSRISGKSLEFSPSRPGRVTNLGFKQATLWDALEFLSDRGTVRINGTDFELFRKLRKSLLAGDRLSFAVQNTAVNTFVNDMAGLTGIPFRVTGGRSMAVVNVELQNATLEEIIAKVSEQTGTKIVEDGAALSRR